jgi:hypothetical protein
MRSMCQSAGTSTATRASTNDAFGAGARRRSHQGRHHHTGCGEDGGAGFDESGEHPALRPIDPRGAQYRSIVGQRHLGTPGPERPREVAAEPLGPCHAARQVDRHGVGVTDPGDDGSDHGARVVDAWHDGLLHARCVHHDEVRCDLHDDRRLVAPQDLRALQQDDVCVQVSDGSDG